MNFTFYLYSLFRHLLLPAVTTALKLFIGKWRKPTERWGGVDLLMMRLNEQVRWPLLLGVDGDDERGRLQATPTSLQIIVQIF